MTERFPPVATRAIEALLFDPAVVGRVDAVYPRDAEAWQLALPGLDSLPRPTGERRPLRYCIATEDIVGPVRNGGIGTTYAALAGLLARQGHDITILYLKGTEVENETHDHWVEHYARDGVKFVGVPNYWRSYRMAGTAPHWQAPMYNMYRYLLEHPMDVVHVSEWRGSAYMSLLAKRQGLAFAKTLFLVKTSSPWLWNRLYGSQALDRTHDLTKTLAERRSVELADMVIGGSLHLIQWMASQGYAVPRARAFVQPNVVEFDHLRELMSRRSLAPGARLPIDELVFFGRLEARKGLIVFCQAIRRMLRLGMRLPPRISFMGKPGARLGVRSRQTVLQFIEDETRDWPVVVEVHTGFQQYQALDYLLSGNRLAVMPSLIENSSLAVYEAAICHIPFVASDTGGTAELIAAEDHAKVLCDAHPVPLAARLAEAIERGGHIARPSFDNDRNIETWIAFHDALSRGLVDELLARAERDTDATSTAPTGEKATLDICLFSRGDLPRLRHTLRAVAAQTAPPGTVQIAIDSIDTAAVAGEAAAILSPAGIVFDTLSALDWDMGLAYNRLAERADAEHLLFLEEGAALVPEAAATLLAVARRRGAAALTWFYQAADNANRWSGQTIAELVGSPAEMFFSESAFELPLLVRRDLLTRLGGFTTDFRVLLHERELIAKATLAGERVETVPLMLGAMPRRANAWIERECYDPAATGFRLVRPFLAAVPLAMRELLLVSKGLQWRNNGGRFRTIPDGRGATAVSWDDARMPDAAPPPETETIVDGVSLFRGWRGARAADGERYQGGLLDVRGGVVSGWIKSAIDPDHPVPVEARVEGRVVARAIASRQINAVAGMPEAVRGHGFELAVVSQWSPSHWLARPVVADIVAADGTVIAGGLEVRSRHTRVRGSAFKGYCDPNDTGLIQGWVWQPGRPERRLTVTVYVEGQLLERRLADSHRLDIEEAGIGDGAYGFTVRPPERFLDGTPRRIDVLIADHGIRLSNTPLVLRGRKVTVAKR